MTADLFAGALTAHAAGDLAEAERLYQAAFAADPGHARALSNLAVVRLQQGRFGDGVAELRRSLAIDPAQPLALNNLGSALRASGRAEEALDAFRQAIALDPSLADARVNLAALLDATGRLAEAAEAYDAAAALHGEPAALRHAQGLALYRLGQAEQALAPLRQAVALQPQTAEFLNDLGAALDETGRTEEALDVFGRALALKPDDPQAMNNRALALVRLGRAGEALALYDQAVALQPDYAVAWVNRAGALSAVGRFEEALASAARGAQADPACADAWVRQGDMHGYLGRLEPAKACYARALQLDPDNAPAAFHLAFPLLRQGLYAEGLQIYEQRWRGPLASAAVELPRPKWLGETPVQGKTLLLHSEQGHGDTLMMLRYAPLLARRGATVILSVQGPIEALAREIDGVSAVVPQGQPLPPYDLHVPMMSLPLAFGTRLESIPGEPYLRAPEAARARWTKRLGRRLRPRVGLCWSGSPVQKDDRWRSLPLEALEPLFALDADLYALQTEVREADRPVLASSPVRDLSGELQSYADTAAVMEAMDLVITVCTSAANLSGGLGRPTFVMLGAVADWRWGEAASSRWYPSARLFRQRAVGTWDEVVAGVHDAAKAFLASA